MTALFVSSTVEVVGLVMYDLLLWPSSDYATADTSSSSLFNLNILSKVCSRFNVSIRHSAVLIQPHISPPVRHERYYRRMEGLDSVAGQPHCKMRAGLLYDVQLR